MSAWSDAVMALAPYAYYRMDETSGTVANDSSGNGLHATLSASTYNLPSLVPGSTGPSVGLTGTDMGVQTPTIALPSVGCTHAVTFKGTTAGSGAAWFDLNSATSFQLQLDSTNPRFWLEGTRYTLSGYTVASLLDGVAHLVVLVVRAAVIEMWVDGVLVSSVAHNKTSTTLTFMRLRRSAASAAIPGMYDEWALFSSPLSSAQIGTLKAGWDGSAPGTVVVAGGQAAETDAAQAGATRAGAVVSGGQAAETDAPQGGSARVAAPGAQGSETDQGQSGVSSAGAVAAGGQGSEFDEARPGGVASAGAIPGNQGAEDDTAHSGTVTAGAVVAGGTAAETDTPQGGSVAGPVDPDALDLSTYVEFYDSVDYDGGDLSPISGPMYVSFPVMLLDATTEYVLEVDYVHTGAGSYGDIQLLSVSDLTPAGLDASNWYVFADSPPIDPSTSGTYSVTIGPGIAQWGTAHAAGEHYGLFQVAALNVTAIRLAASVVDPGPDPVPVGTALSREGGRTRDGMATATWEPAVVPPPGVMASSEHRRIRAAAFGLVTMNGPQPVYAISQATAPRLRTRILIGGKDVSFLDGIPTPEPDWQLAEPLLWGTSSVELPSIPAAFFDAADYPWLAKGKPVVYQRVTSDGTKVGVDYRGVIVAHDVSGKTLRLEVGGHGSGRAALRRKPLPIFRDTLDLGRLAWAAVRDLGLKFEPRLGPSTGIKQALFGGTDYLAYISDLCAKGFDRDGQWSLMPDEGGTYRFARKDTTTVHWTLYNDDTRVVAALRSDAAEEPNRIFASGVTPKGQRVRFGVYPGLKPGDAPPYPFNDGRTFGLGTEDSETDTGDGVFVMIRKMWTAGYLSLEDATGDYDQDVTRALMSLQENAGLNPSGNMNPDTWDALFDLNVTGYTLRGSRIEPAAQDYRVRRYNRSASGQVIGRNPNFDPHRLIVDREIDFGAGLTRHRMREFSRAEVYRGEDNWVGTITITTGAILRGNIAPGATITEADLADVRDIRPGENVLLPLFAGGILVHVSGVEITRTESGHPVARLTVDTQARDAMPVWEIIRRNKETRKDSARRWTGNRASSQDKDSIIPHDEVMGVLFGDRHLRPGWNVMEVPAGQEGTVSRLRLIVQDLETTGGDVAISGREFACAVFGRAVTPKRLRTLIGNPLAGSPDATAEPDPAEVDPPATDPEAGGADPAPVVSPARPWWERKENVAALRDLDLLYSAGTHEEPCGYGPGRKSKGATRTGVHRSDAGFSYRTRREPVLYLAVWVWGDRTLSGGRIMWPLLEGGV